MLSHLQNMASGLYSGLYSGLFLPVVNMSLTASAVIGVQLLGDGRILLVHRFNQLQRVLNGQGD